jgi:hypothetical protein
MRSQLVRGLLRFSRCEKLVAEARDSSGTHAVGSRYEATVIEDVSVDTSVCV